MIIMKETSISLFKGYSDTHPQDSTLQEIVNLIRNDALVRDRTEKHRYYSHNGQKAAAAWEKAACPCFAVAVCFGGGKQAENITGWTSLIVSIWAIGGLQLLAIGVIGQYIGKVYLETKERPKFIIETYLSDEDADADKDKTQK